MGFDFLPKDATIVLDNAKERKAVAGMQLLTSSTDDSTSDLIHFSLPVQPSKLAGTRRRNEVIPLSGNVLLDSGASGCSVVSSSFAKQLLNNDSCVSVDSVKHNISTAGNNNLTSNEVVNFNIAL